MRIQKKLTEIEVDLQDLYILVYAMNLHLELRLLITIQMLRFFIL